MELESCVNSRNIKLPGKLLEVDVYSNVFEFHYSNESWLLLEHKVEENVDFVLCMCIASFLRLLACVMSCYYFRCQLLGEKSDFEVVSMTAGIGNMRIILIRWWIVKWYLWQAMVSQTGTNMSCLQQFSVSLICYFHLSWSDGMRVGFPVLLSGLYIVNLI